MAKKRSLANRTTKVDSGQASKNLRNFDSQIINNLKRNKKAGF
jgi:hypothetical protein